MDLSTARWPRDHPLLDGGGFSLVEVLIAVGLLAVLSASAATLPAMASRVARVAGSRSQAVILAADKLEQLRGLRFGRTVDDGRPVTDSVSDLSFERPQAGGRGLTASPSTALIEDSARYVDYLDIDGAWAGHGPPAPAGAAYVRRWSVGSLSARGAELLVLQVVVHALATTGGQIPSGPGSLDAGVRLVALRARQPLR